MDVSILTEVSKDAKLKVWFSQTIEICDLTKRLAPKWCFVVETKRSPKWCIGGSHGRGRIFSHVRPFCEWGVSDLDLSRCRIFSHVQPFYEWAVNNLDQ